MKKVLLALLPIIILLFIYIVFFRKHPNSTSGGPSPSPSNDLTLKGSDTEVQMISNIAQVFSQQHKDANISVTGGGSGVGIAALLNKEIDIANSSRKMSTDEAKQAQDKGLSPAEFVVARDGITIITNKSNPLKQLTVDQLGKMYTGKITNWKEVGGKNLPITLYGRQSTSGTYTFFRSTVLHDDYTPNMRSLEGNEAIVSAVETDGSGLGYVGVGYVKNEDGSVKNDLNVVLIASDAATPAISPLDTQAVLSGKYPIFRAIYQYLPSIPSRDSLAARFLQFEASDEGQELVTKSGFYSLTSEDKEANARLFEKMP